MQKITLKALLLGCSVTSLVTLFSGIYCWQHSSSPRIAYLNTDKLLSSYQAMVTARHQYQQQKQEWEHNLTTLANEARQAAILVKQAPRSLAVNERLRRTREAELKQQQFLTYRQAIIKQDPQEMQRLTQPVVIAVNRFIAAYSQTHQYDLVLTTAGQGDVVYSTGSMDITADVLVTLNKHWTDSLNYLTRRGTARTLVAQPD